MKEINFSASACRYCRFYHPEGRRGGSCKMLGVPVESTWDACTLASTPFEDTTLQKLEDIFQLETSLDVTSNIDRSPKITESEISAINNINSNFQTTVSRQLE